MKILFVIPKNKSLFGSEGATAHPHVGIVYLSAFLKTMGIEIRVFDHGVNGDIQNLRRLIDDFRPDMIGITIFSYCYCYAYELITAIQKMTTIPIAAGGAHISAIGKKIMEEVNVQFAVKQEGEYTILELLNELQKPVPDFASIKGLIWRDKDGKVKENPFRDYILDLDSLPFPDYESFDIEKYSCFKQKALPIITSRGCPFSCNYCSVQLSMGRRFRTRSAENVYSEIKYFYDKGWVNFDINDDCFTLDMKRAGEICDLIINNGLKLQFQLYNGIRVDSVSPNLLRKMKKAGCYFISYGCETGNEKVLKTIKKGITLNQVKNAVKWTNEAGINSSVNFIIGHKEETYENALDTLRFARSLKTNVVNIYNLLPYPGTELIEWAERNAKLLVPSSWYLANISYRDNNPVFETKEFTKEQRQKILAMGFNLSRKSILRFRLGKFLGSIIYFFTKNENVNRILTGFAINNPLGRAIYMRIRRGPS